MKVRCNKLPSLRDTVNAHPIFFEPIQTTGCTDRTQLLWWCSSFQFRNGSKPANHQIEYNCKKVFQIQHRFINNEYYVPRQPLFEKFVKDVLGWELMKHLLDSSFRDVFYQSMWLFHIDYFVKGVLCLELKRDYLDLSLSDVFHQSRWVFLNDIFILKVY